MTRDIVRFSIVMGVISVAAALGIAGVYGLTERRIAQKNQAAFEAAMCELFPDAAEFVNASTDGGKWEGQGVGVALGAERKRLGYLAIGEKQGYSSVIKVLVATDTNFTISAIRILSSAETPGLGEKVKEVKSERTIWRAIGERLRLIAPAQNEAAPIEPWFQAQFGGKTLDRLVLVKGQAGDKIQAITSATITSQAVTDAVRDAVEEIQKAAPAK